MRRSPPTDTGWSWPQTLEATIEHLPQAGEWWAETYGPFLGEPIGEGKGWLYSFDASLLPSHARDRLAIFAHALGWAATRRAEGRPDRTEIGAAILSRQMHEALYWAETEALVDQLVDELVDLQMLGEREIAQHPELYASHPEARAVGPRLAAVGYIRDAYTQALSEGWKLARGVSPADYAISRLTPTQMLTEMRAACSRARKHASRHYALRGLLRHKS